MFYHENSRIYKIILYRAIFMFLYYGLMRIGEVVKGPHVVKAKDVHLAENKSVILAILYSSKTHTRGDRPQKIKIQHFSFDKTDYEPLEEINKYFTIETPICNR